MARNQPPSPHAWRDLFSSTSGYADARRHHENGYLTDEQLTQAIYELDHAGVVISRGLAERADIEAREVEAWELRQW